jgi:hypothetical protein
MSDYEIGMVWSFILCLLESINRFNFLNSQFSRNLRKVGIRLKWSNGMPTMMEFTDLLPSKIHTTFKIFLFFIIGCFYVFLSWIYVVYSLFTWIKFFYKNNFNIPEVIKIARFKLKNSDMDFDEVLLQIYQLDKFLMPKMKNMKFFDYKENHLEKMKFFGTEELLHSLKK